MKKFTLLALLAIFSLTFSYGQRKSSKITPAKANIEFIKNCDFVQLPGLSKEYVDQENAKLPKDGTLWEIGRRIPANLSMENSGTWFDAPNGDRVWVLRVKTPGAIAITAEISDLFIPVGGSLYIYDPAGNTSYGRYSNADNAEFFGSDFIMGDEVIFEYVQPADVNGTARMNIDDLMHLYRGVNFKGTKSLYGNWQGSESCEVNIVCTPEGTNWVDEAKGVCVIYVVTSAGAGFCTGSLINNTAQNCTPYLLSAWHCYEGATAANLNSWRFLFKYQSTTCTTQATEPVYTMLTGCTLKAQGSINGGSDFILLLLNTAIPTTINAYMNGWNKSTTASTGGVSIHHPAGDIKKISTYTSSLVSSSYTGGASGAHWRVTWATTTNGNGVTEGGSSGSPIFDNNGYIVGTLTGGSSYCTATSNPDYYGKFSYHWNSTANGTTDAYRLQPWLDPTSSGVTTLAGMVCPATTTTLDANFTGTPTSVNVGGTVQFTDISTGTITGRSWSFPGGNPATSTATNPTVVYPTAGQYNVVLTVTGTGGTNTETKTNYITVSSCVMDGYNLDFECSNDWDIAFSPWTVNDVDLLPTYGIDDGTGNNVVFNHSGEAMAFLAFNPASCVPVQTAPAPHGGVRFGACMAGVPGTVTANNDWLISPKVQLGTGSSITMWVKAHSATYAERFKVGVSTTTNAPASFTTISTGSYETPTTTWVQKTYSLTAYNNQQVYVGINCVSVDAFIFCVDDIKINTTVDALNFDMAVSYINVYPNPANDYLFIDYKSVGNDFRSVEVYNTMGQQIRNISMENTNTTAKVLDISSLEKGVYIIKVNTARGTKIEKITKY